MGHACALRLTAAQRRTRESVTYDDCYGEMMKLQNCNGSPKVSVALRVLARTKALPLKPARGWERGSWAKEQPPQMPFEPAT